MLQSRTARALSTLCFLLLLPTGCSRPVRIAAPLKPAAEKLQCVAGGDRPAVVAEYVIDWSKVEVPGDARATLLRAQGEASRLVASIRSREGVLVGYILRIEGELFACSSNAAWLRDFYAGLPDK